MRLAPSLRPARVADTGAAPVPAAVRRPDRAASALRAAGAGRRSDAVLLAALGLAALALAACGDGARASGAAGDPAAAAAARAPGTAGGGSASGSAGGTVAAAIPLTADARTQLDSGNAAFRTRAYDRALTHYRRAAAVQPGHEAPLYGIRMVADARGDRALADSAMAALRAGARAGAPWSDSSVAAAHDGRGTPALPTGHPTMGDVRPGAPNPHAAGGRTGGAASAAAIGGAAGDPHAGVAGAPPLARAERTPALPPGHPLPYATSRGAPRSAPPASPAPGAHAAPRTGAAPR